MAEEAKAEEHLEKAAEAAEEAKAEAAKAEAAVDSPGHGDAAQDAKEIDPLVDAIEVLSEAVEELCLAQMERDASEAIAGAGGSENTSKSTAAASEMPPPPTESTGVVVVEEVKAPERVSLAQAQATPGKRSRLRKFLYGRHVARE